MLSGLTPMKGQIPALFRMLPLPARTASFGPGRNPNANTLWNSPISTQSLQHKRQRHLRVCLNAIVLRPSYNDKYEMMAHLTD